MAGEEEDKVAVDQTEDSAIESAGDESPEIKDNAMIRLEANAEDQQAEEEKAENYELFSDPLLKDSEEVDDTSKVEGDDTSKEEIGDTSKVEDFSNADQLIEPGEDEQEKAWIDLRALHKSERNFLIN